MATPPTRDIATRIDAGGALGSGQTSWEVQVPPAEGDEIIRIVAELAQDTNLKTAAEHLVAAVVRDEPAMARVAIFSMTTDAKSLTPLATAEPRPGKYQLSKHLLRQVVKEQRLIVLQSAASGAKSRFLAMPIAGSALVIYAEIEASSEVAAEASVLKLARTVLVAQPRIETLALLQRLDHWVTGTAKTIAAAVEAKDTYTSGHSERVCRYSDAIGRTLHLTERELELLSVSALCHDLGKIGVPDAILKKPGMLSAEEFEEMKCHPMIGANIIGHAPGSQAIISGIRSHHERWDGTGYPDGLAGDAIPLFARIIAVADAFDAMTSGRSYSGFMSQQEAVQSLLEKEDLFDKKILAAFQMSFQNGGLSMRTGTQVVAIGA